MQTSPEILSIDITNHCNKQCPFCYNHSHPDGLLMWNANELVSFAKDCISHGTKAISLGGGEPFDHPQIFDIIDNLTPMAYVTVTSNGLPLLNKNFRDRILKSAPHKIHISIHFPENREEVTRVISQIKWLKTTPIKPGVNILVSKHSIKAAHDAYAVLREELNPDRIILLPMRYSDTPSPDELAYVAGHSPFQSPSCLLGCFKPQNFVSVTADKKINCCSYAGGHQRLRSLDFAGLQEAMNKIIFISCNKKTSC